MPDAEQAGSERAQADLGLVVMNDSQCRTEAEILHGLSNVLVSILLNAQLIDWKLPTYSRLRRNVHEIERGAQRAGTLLKHLADAKKIRRDSKQRTGKGKESDAEGFSSRMKDPQCD